MPTDEPSSSSSRIRIVIFISAIFAAGAWDGYGQILHPTGQTPSFEVATIKRSPDDFAGRHSLGPTGAGRFEVKSCTVKELIAFAYTTDSDRQIQNVLGWMSSERYDIEAKVSEAEATEIAKLPPMQRMDPLRLMVQALLADRFHLKAHFEVRELPAYALVQAKGGSKMTPTVMNPSNASETLKPRLLQMKGQGDAVGTGVTTAMLAELLERQAEVGKGEGRTVVDKTNLTGLYGWTLHWASWREQSGQASSDSGAPSLFTALQEQLGLRLEPTKTKVEIVVIDSMERPSEN